MTEELCAESKASSSWIRAYAAWHTTSTFRYSTSTSISVGSSRQAPVLKPWHTCRKSGYTGCPVFELSFQCYLKESSRLHILHAAVPAHFQKKIGGTSRYLHDRLNSRSTVQTSAEDASTRCFTAQLRAAGSFCLVTLTSSA